MHRSSLYRLCVLAMLAIAGTGAHAHPHVWVTVTSELLYAPDKTITAIRHHWVFDDMFSTFAIQGLDSNNDGKLSREELHGLAEVNVSSIKDFDYFTRAQDKGERFRFGDASDFWMEHGNGRLTLHFTLPLPATVRSSTIEFDLYDETYFVDIRLAEGDAVQLVNAPATCTLMQGSATGVSPPPHPLFSSPGATGLFRSHPDSKIKVICKPLSPR